MTRMQLIYKLERAWLAKISAKENRAAECIHWVCEALEAKDFKRALQICKTRNLPANLPDNIRLAMKTPD